MKKITDYDVDILARTIYGEARGEYAKADGGVSSLIAVANVVYNRLKKNPKRFGQSVAEVCLKPLQFSCWNKNDANYALISTPKINSDPLFSLCRQVASEVTAERWPDVTKGSDHYHTTSITPSWSKGITPAFRLSHHVFYSLEGK